MAEAVFDIGTEYGLISQMEAMVFDTTASNTGVYKGSGSIFEKMIKKPLLWIACRHHVPELHIKHASEVLRGPSKGPDDPLFKRFKEIFENLEMETAQLGNGQKILTTGDINVQQLFYPGQINICN